MIPQVRHASSLIEDIRLHWIAIGNSSALPFYLWTEHRAHLYGTLPYLIVLLCPLMHLFMGHGGHGHDDQNRDEGRA